MMKKFLATILFSLFLFPISLITGCGGEQVAVNAIKVYPAQLVETTKRAIEEASK